MRSGWLAAGVAFALAAALAILVVPREAAGDLETMSADDEAEIAVAQVRETGIAQMPAWRVGDSWNVQFGEGEPVCWAVIVAETEEGFEQGIWCSTDEAEFIATQIAVIAPPYIGRFSPEIEGLSGEEATRWFDWPLEHGKTWSTSLLGTEVEARAELAEGRFVVEMRDEVAEVVAFYDYDPTQRWWSQLVLDGFELFVRDAERGWDGPVTRAIAEAHGSASGSPAVNSFLSFPADDEDDFVILLRELPAGAIHVFSLTQPDGTIAAAEPTMPIVNLGSTTRYRVFDAQPGTWEYRDSGFGGGFSAQLFTVKVDEIVL